MITDITLENFKGFRHLEIQPKRITAFVGPNGTGKSSVLQAFGLLKQKAEFSAAFLRTLRGWAVGEPAGIGRHSRQLRTGQHGIPILRRWFAAGSGVLIRMLH